MPEWEQPSNGKLRKHATRWVKPLMITACQYRPMRSVLCWRFPPQDPQQVALTFDDGPHPKYTHEVLDVLAERSVRATFFVVGQRVERYPDVFQRILRDGHDFGIHGYFHDTHNHKMPRQTQRTLDIFGHFGVTSSLFRPPNGVMDLRTQMWMARNGFTTVLWSFDLRDSMRYEGIPVECDPIASIRPGEILLLHDDNPVCVAELGPLLDHLDANEIVPRAISALLAA